VTRNPRELGLKTLFIDTALNPTKRLDRHRNEPLVRMSPRLP
jgi:hypothetical protein